ncbi:MAG: hypothetical protein ACE5KD_00505 [Candidatus Bathyarchaeia archaeon]
MSFIDKIAEKLFNKQNYEEYNITDSMDGCVGEDTISKIRKALEKLIPC